MSSANALSKSTPLHAYATHTHEGQVDLSLGSDDDAVFRVRSTADYTRVNVRLSRKQAVALAYKLLHAANEGHIDEDPSPPESRVR